jgi:oligosaccharide repeat unit polymerase
MLVLTLLVTILALSILLAILYKMSGDFLFPPVIFTAVWLSSMIGVLLSWGSYYEIECTAYVVYLVGAISFSIGGALVFLLRRGNINGRTANLADHTYNNHSIHCALDIGLIVVIVGLPLYWREMSTLVSGATDSSLLFNIRQKMVELADERTTLSVVRNCEILSILVSIAMAYEMDGTRSRRWRTVIAVAVTFMYGVISATKMSLITIILYVFFVYSIKRKHVNVRTLLTISLICIIVFVAGMLAINYSYMSFASTTDMLAFLFGRMVGAWWLGGIVAFSQIAETPNIIISTQPIYRFFLETARSLGMNVYVPPKHAEYLNFSPYADTNAYTIYFCYFKDYGWAGMVILMLFLGAALVILYRKALRGGPVAVQFYAMMCGALVLSFVTEHFFLGLNFYLKAAIFYYVLYKIVPALYSSRRRIRVQHA